MSGEEWFFVALFGALMLLPVYLFLDAVRDASKSPRAKVMWSILSLVMLIVISMPLFLATDSPVTDGRLALWAANAGVQGVIGYAITVIGGLGACLGLFMGMGSAPMGYKDGSGPEPSLGPAMLLLVSGGAVLWCGLQIAAGTYWAIPIALIAAVVGFAALVAIFSD
ncbi:MAG: hypothetical protein OEQ39_15890 [Gammaproteobacteria bacterium]|nr:hypothetical protein [Gammaproteobacteria bacterium]